MPVIPTVLRFEGTDGGFQFICAASQLLLAQSRPHKVGGYQAPISIAIGGEWMNLPQ